MAQSATEGQSLTQSPIPPWLEDLIKIIFSWVVLMPIAVIVSGKFLAQRFTIPSRSEQLFRIPLGVFHIQADGDEVILGFSGFIITLFAACLLAGNVIYARFKSGFGIDPGQFNSLCIFSSFATVVWAVILYLLTRPPAGPLDSVSSEHASLIEKLSEDDRGQR